MRVAILNFQLTGMKLVTWNVNGLRTITNLKEIFGMDPDIVCFQETKLSRSQLGEFYVVFVITSNSSCQLGLIPWPFSS